MLEKKAELEKAADEVKQLRGQIDKEQKSLVIMKTTRVSTN